MLSVQIESHTLTRDHTNAMRIIEQGEAAQRHAGPAFAAAAEELREMGITRITRNGLARFYTFTPAGRQVFSALGDTRIGGGL